MRFGTIAFLGMSALSLSACSGVGGGGFGFGGYSLIRAKEVRVGNGTVAAIMLTNSLPRGS